mmetsp:Transcript_12320/g.19994  ORF Transcript_12320/g.19994 Transcript_12320/m.19994 type:complete len:125 (-) Transcript_12320:48-422(-)
MGDAAKRQQDVLNDRELAAQREAFQKRMIDKEVKRKKKQKKEQKKQKGVKKKDKKDKKKKKKKKKRKRRKRRRRRRKKRKKRRKKRRKMNSGLKIFSFGSITEEPCIEIKMTRDLVFWASTMKE